MTVTDARWWAPAEPGIGPDEFDLELLEPGDNPAADLGQAFLALHRVGAAACEAVATEPLADESALAFALANARRLVAPEASQIVSKAVGDNPNYGNLLIRDVLDDAEATALSLWRSCIAKSVPASTTAKRVGMVYGLPPGELYAFQKLATDPKANPVALQETADKALFTHIAKLVTEEAVERKVEISKERPARAARSDWWEEEPRDAGGQWTAEPVAPGDAVPTPPEQVPTRARRAQRAQRGKRQARVSAGRPAGHEAGAAAGVSAGVSAGASAGVSAGVGVSVSALRGPSPTDHLPPNPLFDPKSRSPRAVGDVTKPFAGQEHGEYVDQQLSFVLPSDEWQSFMRAAPSSELGKMFRAGRLEEYIGRRANVYQAEGVDQTTKEHETEVSRVAAQLRGETKAQPVLAHRITVDPSLGGDTTEVDLANATTKWMSQELGLTPAEIGREMAHVDYLSDLENPQRGVYVVYTPQVQGRSRDADRPIAQVTEIVVNDEDLFGSYRSGSGGAGWSINRNQMLTTSGVFSGARNRRFWDAKNQVIRNVVYTHVTDEEVGKALSPERFHALEEQGRIHRDEQGEFSREQPAPAKQARRATRAQRGKRLVARPVGSASAGVSAGRTAGRAATGGGGQSAARSGVRARISDDSDPDLLTFREDYHSVVPAYVDLGFGFHRKSPSEGARVEIDRASEAFGDEVNTHIAGVTMDKFNDHGGREVSVFHDHNATAEDLADLASKIHTEMTKDANFTLARVRIQRRHDGTADVEVFRNQRPLGIVDVIRWGTANKIRPYRLFPEDQGRYQTEKTIKYWLEQAWDSADHADDHTDDDWIANPHIHVWRAQQL